MCSCVGLLKLFWLNFMFRILWCRKVLLVVMKLDVSVLMSCFGLIVKLLFGSSRLDWMLVVSVGFSLCVLLVFRVCECMFVVL